MAKLRIDFEINDLDEGEDLTEVLSQAEGLLVEQGFSNVDGKVIDF